MEWTLEDVEETNRLFPLSFFIPSEQERRAQTKGRQVRLHFTLANPAQGDPRTERMWVEIMGQDPDTLKYTGVLTNAPVSLKTLQAGDVLEFEPRHIAQTILRKGDPSWVEVGEKVALVSKKCLIPGSAVRWMYRVSGDREQDSGWRLFAGDEDNEYLSNPNNTRLMNVYYILDLDPSLLEPFKREEGTAFERQSKDAEWVEVTDWARDEQM